MANSLERSKGRATHASFVGLPRHVIDSEAFVSLPLLARALYVDLRRQYNGKNNGDISIADTLLAPLGWAHSSIHKALAILIQHNLIVRLKKGGATFAGETNRAPSLYAFTDLAIAANPSKGIAGAAPLGTYRNFKAAPKKMAQKKTTCPQRDSKGLWGGRMNVHNVTRRLSKVHGVDVRFALINGGNPCPSTLSGQYAYFLSKQAIRLRGGHLYKLPRGVSEIPGTVPADNAGSRVSPRAA